MVRICCLILLLVITWFTDPVNLLHAKDQNMVNIEVEADFEAAQAVGILISETGIQQRLPATFTRVSPTKYRVSFDYRSKQITPTTLATALLILEDGKIVMSEPIPFFKYSDESMRPLPKLPACPPDPTTQTRLQGQEGNYQALINIRQERREIVRSKIGLYLTPERLKELAGLEEGFGLSRQHPLSIELDPYELLDRLTRLKIAIKSYQYHRSMATK